ncbi:argininosuccinate lyase [Methanococcoides methylutens]|uniref:Argininosuccinate lyase n=1 Tax=Methanococcoides methylutens MM1 TaxID=1434104 RepID=A0A0E3X1U4_METMT|nr:argininosuccinate lyase [Methanococcoides methylutens]AKB85559.1 Argininosuccinate lyase [Methanococcoides methylutens MM1]
MSDILRRGRLASVPDEEIIEFTSSMSADKWIFNSDILVDLAHTVMLKERNVIRAEDCREILKGLLKIREEGIEKLDHTYEDIHISLESRLIDMVGEDVGGRMHSGRSRNDEVATCIRLTLRNELLLMMEDLLALRNTLIDVASENVDTLMPGFTHLQHAQPTTLAHHLTAHANAIGRDFERTRDCYARVNMSPLGAAAFASTGFDLDRERTRTLLGFDGIVENSMDAVSSRDFLIETASVFANLMINLSKMAEELVIWSTSEFAFIELDDRYASTSSIMPQKKNPDTAELLRGKSGVAIGSLMSLISICKALPLSYNRDLQEATPNMWRSLKTTRSSVRVMNGMIATMKINRENMAGLATAGFTTATELADTMVRVCDIPFRTAHQIVGVLARGSGEPTLGEIDAVAHNVIGESLSGRGLTEQMVNEALDPTMNVRKRTVTGGPSPETMQQLISNCKDRSVGDEDSLKGLKANVDSAMEALFSVVDDCMDA